VLGIANAITAQLAESSSEGQERTMRDRLVAVLTSLAEEHPYLLAGCAFIGAFWLARSVIHKARLFTEHLLKEVRGVKGELREWFDVITELVKEFIPRRDPTSRPPATDTHSDRQKRSDLGAA
jgi:hypothetical protein